ncbi:Tim44 domain-containing protein [Microvirga pudoricolor]|uniref:Tim44 domain-containing protein n=1 Tax=Microvirga pudoricolor TaxID=2778729 RepID=UPI001950D280|nr:Tim44 domain-containing protein [Microvirga pudoricolor]MBM6592750.1 Tim44 domain-containing protein [Microvirga pudoricolor]
MMKTLSRKGQSIAVLAVLLTLAAGIAEARPGGGRGSFGSRGARTYSAPPPTATAPNAAAPIQRSQTNPSAAQPSAPMAGASAAQPRRFGFGTGLAAGLFGAGLLGMLMGNGFFGGLAGLGSILGLVIQIGLVVLLVSFAMKWFRRRQQAQPAYATAQTHARNASPGPRPAGPTGAGLGSALGGLGRGTGNASAPQGRPVAQAPIQIGERDYAAFDKALVDLQAAYTRGDTATIWDIATPEMAGYIQEELNDNASNGVVNSVTNVKLLQGDLAEAWREGSAEYATVAMRYALTDVTTEKATGRIMDGDPNRVTETVEIWTFRRDAGGPWKLSAIQQG